MLKPKYRPNYPDLDEVSEGMTPTGRTSKELAGTEEIAQRVVATAPEWWIARKINSTPEGYVHNKGDSRKELERLGFKVTSEADDLFYVVQPPEGWDKETEGYWTNVRDKKGRVWITQFFKGAFYDRDAFINIQSPNKDFDLCASISDPSFASDYDIFQNQLQQRFGIEPRNLRTFISDNVRDELFRKQLLIAVRDGLHRYVGIDGKQHDECDTFERFVWHYFFPLFDALDNGILKLEDVDPAIINGFTGEAPYPHQLVRDYTPSYKHVKGKSQKLSELKELAKVLVADSLASFSRGVVGSGYFRQSQEFPIGLRLYSNSFASGIFALKDGVGIITSYGEKPDNFRLELRTDYGRSLDEQLEQMDAIEPMIEDSFRSYLKED